MDVFTNRIARVLILFFCLTLVISLLKISNFFDFNSLYLHSGVFIIAVILSFFIPKHAPTYKNSDGIESMVLGTSLTMLDSNSVGTEAIETGSSDGSDGD